MFFEHSTMCILILVTHSTKTEKVPILGADLTEKVPILGADLTEKVPISCANKLKYLHLQLNKRNIICCIVSLPIV